MKGSTWSLLIIILYTSLLADCVKEETNKRKPSPNKDPSAGSSKRQRKLKESNIGSSGDHIHGAEMEKIHETPSESAGMNLSVGREPRIKTEEMPEQMSQKSSELPLMLVNPLDAIPLTAAVKQEAPPQTSNIITVHRDENENTAGQSSSSFPNAITSANTAGQSSSTLSGAITSAKNWISSNLDSIKKIKKEKNKEIDTFLTASDFVWNMVTGQIGSAIFSAVKGQVENSEREKEREEFLKHMEQMNKEFNKFYESLKIEFNEAILRMERNKNQGNDRGYFDRVIIPLEYLQDFYNALFENEYEHKTEEFQQYYINAIKELEKQCRPENIAMHALKTIQTYVNDLIRPNFYSVYILDHSYKKKELISFARTIEFHASQLFTIANVCIKFDNADKKENLMEFLYSKAKQSSTQFKIIEKNYFNIKISLNNWINRALDLAWPDVIKEKAIPDAIEAMKSEFNLMNDSQISYEMLQPIAQKIANEANQYGRECFKYHAIVVKHNDSKCTWKELKCPRIDLPKYSKFDPDNSKQMGANIRNDIKHEEAISSSSRGNVGKLPICIDVQHSGLRIILSRSLIVDDNEEVETHSWDINTVISRGDSNILQNFSILMKQEKAGGLVLEDDKENKCPIGVATEPGGIADYGLKKYDWNLNKQDEKKMHLFLFNPKIFRHEFKLYNLNMHNKETIFIDAKLFVHSDSYTINFLNKYGIVLHHHQDLEKQQIETGQMKNANDSWEKPTKQVAKCSLPQESFHILIKFESPVIEVQFIDTDIYHQYAWFIDINMLAPIEQLVIAGDLELQSVIQMKKGEIKKILYLKANKKYEGVPKLIKHYAGGTN